jgi:hypothetical protein
MAGFDPSVIADIGGNVPDIAGAQQKALTLADLYDQNKLNKIKVQDAETQQADMTYAKQILSGTDLSDLKAQNAAVAKITQRNPELGMKLMSSFQSGQERKAQNDITQLELYDKKNDIIGGQLYQLKAQHDQLAQQGMNEQQIHDAMKDKVIGFVKGLAGQTLPDGSPLLNEQDRALLKQGLGNGYSVPFIDSMVSRSQQARTALNQKLEAARAESAGDKQDTIKGDPKKMPGTDAGKYYRVVVGADGKVKSVVGEAPPPSSVVSINRAEQSKLDPEDAHFMAQQYLAGDKSVLQGFGRGAQGPANIIMVRKAIREEAQSQGLSPADIAGKLAEYSATIAEERKIGSIAGGVEFANAELTKFLPLARESSAKVERGNFVPYTTLVQKGEAAISDPNLRDLYVKTQSVLNAYDVLAARGGTDASKREHNRQLLTTADSPEAYEAALHAIEQELAAAKEAGPEAMRSVAGQLTNKPKQPGQDTSGPSAATTPKAAAPAPPPGFVVQ